MISVEESFLERFGIGRIEVFRRVVGGRRESEREGGTKRPEGIGGGLEDKEVEGTGKALGGGDGLQREEESDKR